MSYDHRVNREDPAVIQWPGLQGLSPNEDCGSHNASRSLRFGEVADSFKRLGQRMSEAHTEIMHGRQALQEVIAQAVTEHACQRCYRDLNVRTAGNCYLELDKVMEVYASVFSSIRVNLQAADHVYRTLPALANRAQASVVNVDPRLLEKTLEESCKYLRALTDINDRNKAIATRFTPGRYLDHRGVDPQRVVDKYTAPRTSRNGVNKDSNIQTSPSLMAPNAPPSKLRKTTSCDSIFSDSLPPLTPPLAESSPIRLELSETQH